MFRRLTLVVLAAQICTAALAQNIHYEQNFDGLNDGDMDGQDEWRSAPQPAAKARPSSHLVRSMGLRVNRWR